MVDFFCPPDNWNERTYVIGILLGEFLGIEFSMKPDPETTEYRIVLENGNEVIIQDHFFSRFKQGLEYLNAKNCPTEVIRTKNQFISEDAIPVLFGSELLEIKSVDSRKTIITAGQDIFASSFFMLTRWEEYVSEIRDPYERFSARESIAFKNNYLQRPIVNEYVDFLWNMLKFAGLEQERKSRDFSVYITHDVDYVLRWYSFYGFLRTLAADLIKRRSIRTFIWNLGNYILTILAIRKDPYNTFDKMMSLSEKYGFQSHFFFMSVEPQYRLKHFSLSKPFVRKLIQEIDSRGHHIGFHPYLNTYKDFKKWKREKEWLQSYSPQEILSGRQHFLQIEFPDTWQIWNDMKMRWDSSVSYDEIPGFRAGTCFSYKVFNFLTREELDLIERPLTIMDKSLVMHNMSKGISEMENDARKLIDIVKKHRGEFVLLWHNNCFNVPEWKPYEELYPAILEYLNRTLNVK